MSRHAYNCRTNKAAWDPKYKFGGGWDEVCSLAYLLRPGGFGLLVDITVTKYSPARADADRSTTNSGVNAGMFGGVALFAVIFYASGIPTLQKDLLQVGPFHEDNGEPCDLTLYQGIPYFGKFYINDKPASDNVSSGIRN